MNIFRLDGDTFSVDGSQVGVFKETYKVSFRGFLESTNGRRLETEISFKVLGNFTNKTLEWEFTDKEFSRFLVTTNFTESDGTGSVSVRLLDSSSSGGRFTGSLGGKLLTGSFSSSGFSCGLLSSIISSE